MSVEVLQEDTQVTEHSLLSISPLDWRKNTDSLFLEAPETEIEFAFLASFYGYSPLPGDLDNRSSWRETAHEWIVDDLSRGYLTKEMLADYLDSMPSAKDEKGKIDINYATILLDRVSQHPHKQEMYSILHAFSKDRPDFERAEEESGRFLHPETIYEDNKMEAAAQVKELLETFTALEFLLEIQEATVNDRVTDIYDEKSYDRVMSVLTGKFNNPMYLTAVSHELCKILYPYQIKLAILMKQWLDEAQDVIESRKVYRISDMNTTIVPIPTRSRISRLKNRLLPLSNAA